MGPNTHPRYGRAGGIARHLFLVLAMIAAQLPLAQIAAAQQPATRAGAQVPAPNKMHRIAIVLARERRDVPPPLSLVDIPPPDDGIAGARLAISDNNTTGRFLSRNSHSRLFRTVISENWLRRSKGMSKAASRSSLRTCARRRWSRSPMR